MSDSYGRMSHLCAFVPPQSFPCAENDRAIGAATADKAIAEARAILAETEGLPIETLRAVRIGFDVYPFETEIMAGLAQSLAAFVEG